MVPKIKKEEGCTHPQAMKRAGDLWNAASEEEKAPYYKMNAEDKKR
jgi:hypothetical protein